MAETGWCEQALRRLIKYCRSQVWLGYDPYDGLNSPLARALPVNNKFGRTVLIQLVKRSPVNVRPLIGIKKAMNPKTAALALRAIMLLADRYGIALPSQASPRADYEATASDSIASGLHGDFDYLAGSLLSLRSERYEEVCWGYNFDWQSRAFFAPRGTPNMVCTVFAAQACLDWFERTGSRQAFEAAESSCRFILNRLNRTEGGEGHCFSYTPLDRSCVHNVNMLAAELLARAFVINKRDEYREAARSALSYTLARQREDGGWPYGESVNQSWIDGFHTGYVLVSLKRMIQYLGEDALRPELDRGFEFYRERFFLADSTPKYYHDRLYPIDVHSAAQAIITFEEMKEFAPDAERMADKGVKWAIDKLQDRAGFFYFQRHRFYTIKIPYMRWAQAWMFYALSLYFSRGKLSSHV